MVSKDGRENVVQASGTIRASLMSVVAYMFCAEQGVNQITNQEASFNIHRVVQHENDHAYVYQWGFKMPSPVQDREGCFRVMSQKLENDCVVSFQSIEDGRAPPREALRYFNQVKRVEAFEAADAKELGQLLVLDTNDVRGKRDPDPLEAKLRTFVNRSAVLRGARSTCPWIEVMLKEVLRNRLRVPKGSMKALAEFTEEDARKAGRGFANALVANATAEAAVDEWVMTYPALGELELRYPFVRPMMNAVAGAILAQVAWGVKFRAWLGAGVSAADALSDAYMIKTFYDMGDTANAKGLLAMVGANLAYQMLIVYMQTQGLKKNKWRTALFEMLTVVSFTKPGFDAYRVASGTDQLPGAVLDPLAEMVWTKGGELFFEAIPGLVLQLVALLNAEKASKVAIASILISSASTALTATTIFWDMDTDPGARKRNPDWIGIVPDLNRGASFVALFVMSALQVLAKAASVALLAVTNGPWLLQYVIADHAVHLIYRIARNDVIAYVPMPPAASYVVSPLLRVIIKTISDFTGGLTFRLPLMLGGSYWLFNLAMSQVSVFVCVHLYLEYAGDPASGGNKIAAGTLWAGAAGLAAGWLLTFAYFVFRIAVPKFRHTIWSGTTGRQCAQDYFLKGWDEESKFEIFGCILLLWESDIGEEVKAWTAENWARWSEEMPAWFKPEHVPDRFIPVGALQQLGLNRKRRGSAAESIRESFRENAPEEQE
ncbi:hypothetical protein TeGR_g3683 [Tetraparma gracilis]|uniref:Uncharacterized protein n=1 Tax=Tetraparma gracilis TaxID=2962635 RepID=A0ABQ6NEC9_9STRA|nr:hypothetical protein TeGR_g3683 [Tetraparma gracilis]